MNEINYTQDKRDIKTILEYIDKQYISVGKFLQDILAKKAEEKGETFNRRPYMESQRLYVWKPQMASELIQELLIRDGSIAELTLYREDDRSQFRKVDDGQQRLTTIYLFAHDMLTLDLTNSIYPVFIIEGETHTVDELQGKRFSDLPELWRDIFLGRTLRWSCANNCDEDMAEKIYVSRNSNTKLLRPVEIRKAAMGSKVKSFLGEARQSDWLLHAMTPAAVEGNQGDEVFAHFITLLDHNFEPVSLDKDSINSTIYKYRDTGLPNEICNIITKVNSYLNEVTNTWIEDKKSENESKKGRKPSNYNTYRFNKLFNKTNTVMIMVAAKIAIDNDIVVSEFGRWARDFFLPSNTVYRKACGDGHKSKPSDINCVEDRISLIKEFLLSLKESINNNGLLDDVEANIAQIKAQALATAAKKPEPKPEVEPETEPEPDIDQNFDVNIPSLADIEQSLYGTSDEETAKEAEA